MTSTLTALGTLEIPLTDDLDLEFYLIEDNGNYYLSDTETLSNNKILIHFDSDIYYFKSKPTTSVTLPRLDVVNPCTIGYDLCDIFGPHVYQSKTFSITKDQNDKLTLTGIQAFVVENNISYLKMNRLVGVLAPHILFFYRIGATSSVPVGLSVNPDGEDGWKTLYPACADIDQWEVVPYMDNTYCSLTFGSASVSGDRVTIKLEDAHKFITGSFGVQVQPGTKHDIDSYYTYGLEKSFIYSTNYNGLGTKIKFKVTNKLGVTKTLSADFTINMTENCIIYYYLLINIADVQTAFTSAGAPLRSDRDDEIPVTSTWYEVKPL